MYRVACLAWVQRKEELRAGVCRPQAFCDILLKLHAAKEAKGLKGLLWKASRLSERGRRGTAVRTQWQSGIGKGDLPAWTSKGNHPIGDEGQSMGKSSQT